MLHTPTPEDPPVRFLPLAEVIHRVSLSRTEIFRRIKANRFPGSIRLSEARVAWLESDILEWQRGILRAAGRAA